MEKMKRTSLKGMLLLVLMLFMLMPLYAFADEETPFEASVNSDGIIEIGEYMEEPVYYLTAPKGTKNVLFSDFAAEGTDITGMQYAWEEDTNTASLTGEWRIAEDLLRQQIDLKEDLPELDFSNVYFYYIMDADYNAVSFVIYTEPDEIIIPDVDFTVSANGVELTDISKEEEAYTYTDFDGVEYKVPVYTVKIPLGVSTVDLELSQNMLVYNYTKAGVYISGYYSDAFDGATTGTVPVNGNVKKEGNAEADTEFDIIQVQTPYDDNWHSYMPFGITFEYADPEPLSVWATLSNIKDGTPAELPEGYTWKQYPEMITVSGSEAGTASFTDPAVGIKVDDIPVTVMGQPGFEVSADGVVFDKITYSREHIDPQDEYITPFDVDVYTVEIPYSLEKVNFKFTGDVLAYNYTKKGEYIKGWVEDPTVGFREAAIDVDANTDKESDYIYVQLPYRVVDDNWEGGDLHYAVTFKRVADTKQPMSVKAKKAYTVKAKTLKKKTVKLSYKKVMTIKNAKGKLTFKKLSGKKIKISSKGTITVPKKLKKGKYTIKVKVTAAGKDQYKSGYKTVKFTIKVK